MDRWLRRARALVAKAPGFEAELAALERRAAAPAPHPSAAGVGPQAREATDERGTAQIMKEAAAMMRRELAAGTLPPSVLVQFESGHEILDSAAPKHERRASQLEAEVDRARRRRWRPGFAAAGDDRRHEQLVATLANIERLDDDSFGLMRDVQQRRGAAAGLERASLIDERDSWIAAIASIADRKECPLYEGLVIEPQLGLVPLRRDRASGLWEFWHVLSGERPAPADDGALDITPESGIVLILVPGGTYRLGAQSTDPGEPAYDPDAQRAEGPPRLVTLAPYFIGKHEVTQEQWYRATGEQPSETYAGIMPRDNPMTSSIHPVEHVSWVDASRTLARWGLELPTEAQWERAARGNTDGPYWTDEATIIRSVNFFDENARRFSTSEKRADLRGSRIDDAAAGHDDGYSHHAPVDSFPANPFGLHHVLGNVREWTKDAYCQTFRDVRESDFGGSQVLRIDPATGELFPANQNPFKTFRGGAFEDPLVAMRVTTRGRSTRNTREEDRGVRPARRLDRTSAAR
jgi:formylglycine-generating enzyme required for sulfatase activity